MADQFLLAVLDDLQNECLVPEVRTLEQDKIDAAVAQVLHVVRHGFPLESVGPN